MRIEFDYSKLIGRIIEKYGTRGNFATAYGVSNNTISRKLNNITSFSREDVARMASKDFLDIPEEQIADYFFTIKVL